MKLKGIKLKRTYKVVYYDTSVVILDEKGNEIYNEDSNGYWIKWEYNEKGYVTYFEDSNDYWSKSEYDEQGNVIYSENSKGEIIDKRTKELTIEQIENLLGYKIKIKGE